MNSLLYKMKADYLRYIFECLNGDDGLLKNDEQFTQDGIAYNRIIEQFNDDTKEREKAEIRQEE